jgi:cytochrome c
MLPHPQHSLEETRAMLAWIARLAQDSVEPVVATGLAGHFALGENAAGASGTWVLEASYTDRGAPASPTQSASARTHLRTRRVEAEHFSTRSGTQTLDSQTASAGRFVGAIDHGNQLVFERVNLAGITRIVACVSSAGAGGIIHLRAGAPGAAPLASWTVSPNGAWEEWFTLEAALAPRSGLEDLILSFENEENPSALLNLDWLEFHTR